MPGQTGIYLSPLLRSWNIRRRPGSARPEPFRCLARAAMYALFAVPRALHIRPCDSVSGGLCSGPTLFPIQSCIVQVGRKQEAILDTHMKIHVSGKVIQHVDQGQDVSIVSVRFQLILEGGQGL